MDFNETVAFLGSSEVVLTTSYHGLYWATLLGRKVVVLEASMYKLQSWFTRRKSIANTFSYRITEV